MTEKLNNREIAERLLEQLQIKPEKLNYEPDDVETVVLYLRAARAEERERVLRSMDKAAGKFHEGDALSCDHCRGMVAAIREGSSDD